MSPGRFFFNQTLKRRSFSVCSNITVAVVRYFLPFGVHPQKKRGRFQLLATDAY